MDRKIGRGPELKLNQKLVILAALVSGLLGLVGCGGDSKGVHATQTAAAQEISDFNNMQDLWQHGLETAGIPVPTEALSRTPTPAP